MHPFFERLKAHARVSRRRIVFPEGDDPRVIAAAHRLKEERLAEPVLVTAETAGRSPRLPDYTGIYYQRRKSKGVTEETANEIARKPLYFAALMVAAGDADAMVGGSVFTTAETVRAALGAIGPAPGVETVSGAFLMIHHDPRFGYEGAMTFADCAVVIDPSPAQLAEIAISAAATTRQVLETEPIVALLSFSTKGSARHAEVDKVSAALRLIGEIEPGLKVDGELQFDAAVIPEIGSAKAPGSVAAGRANTLVFPNLAAGNIGYKIAERLGGAAAIGPLLLGMAKPASDLSRGCTAEDIYHTSVVTACQA
jgi:phosphate acetyltransferase